MGSKKHEFSLHERKLLSHVRRKDELGIFEMLTINPTLKMTRSEDDEPLLLCLLKEGMTGAVLKLIHKDPTLLRACHFERPFLVHAAEKDRTGEVVAAVLAQGVDPDEPDRFGGTPLLMALQCENWPVARLLLKSGADPNKTNLMGLSPSSIAVGRASQLEEDIEHLPDQEVSKLMLEVFNLFGMTNEVITVPEDIKQQILSTLWKWQTGGK